jgi:hypothetical protein
MEFEDREKKFKNLGELPEDSPRGLYDRRNYRRQRDKNYRLERINDVLYQNDQQSLPSSAGTLPYQANVVAVYDSRFINGRDFVDTNFNTWSITANPPASLSLTSNFTVFGGYNAVVRGFRYEMDPPVPIDIDNLFLDFLVDNVSVVGMTNLALGQITDWIDTFFLASANSTITMQFRAPTGIGSITTDVRKILCSIRGNLLQDTGAPLPLEIANTEKAGYEKYRGTL